MKIKCYLNNCIKVLFCLLVITSLLLPIIAFSSEQGYSVTSKVVEVSDERDTDVSYPGVGPNKEYYDETQAGTSVGLKSEEVAPPTPTPTPGEDESQTAGSWFDKFSKMVQTGDSNLFLFLGLICLVIVTFILFLHSPYFSDLWETHKDKSNSHK